MRASRLLSVLLLLQSRGRMSAQALAKESGVSVRTILRDIEHLGGSGVPITAERGRTGGFELLDGWRTRLTGLTSHEAQALFMGGLPGPAKELGLGEALASAQLKLLATLPEGWQHDARRVGARFHLDSLPWYRSAARANHLPAVSGAVWDERRLKVRYESWAGVVERTLEPLGLVLKAGEWYLVARPAHRPSAGRGTEPRTYRLSNVLELVASDERFERPAAFDLAAFWKESTARFEREIQRGTAVVKATARGLKQLRATSAAIATAIDAARPRRGRGGRFLIQVPIESVEQAASAFLPLGGEVEVLEPAALRSRLLARAKAVLRRYGARRP